MTEQYCKRCDGSGSIPTGIAEASESSCAECGGTGYAKASTQPSASTLSDTIRKALARAYSFGQTYWQQAINEYESESESENRKSEVTQRRYDTFVEETISALPAPVSEPTDFFAVQSATLNQDGTATVNHGKAPPQAVVAPVEEQHEITPPTVDELKRMAYALQLVPEGDVVCVQFLEILKKQFVAALQVRFESLIKQDPKYKESSLAYERGMNDALRYLSDTPPQAVVAQPVDAINGQVSEPSTDQ